MVVEVVVVVVVVEVEVLGGKGTKEGVRAVEVAGAVESEWAVCGQLSPPLSPAGAE